MTYKLKIRKVNNVFVDVEVDYQDIGIDGEVPCGIEYRKQCSTAWDQAKQDGWWNFIDFVLQENSIALSDFVYVWNIEVDGIVYGISNDPSYYGIQ